MAAAVAGRPRDRNGSDNPRSGGAGASSVAAGALRRIPIPEHDAQFWDDLAGQLADEPQLRLRPRAAVRPITQPPPIVDDRLPFDDGDLRQRGRSRHRRRRRVVVWLVAIILSVIVVAVALEGQDDSGDGIQTGAGETTTTEAADEAADSTASTTPAGSIDPAAALTPGGVGPLTVGAPLRDLEAAGSPPIVVDQPTFAASGGTCFDATVTDVPDLVLRFRSPEPGVGIDDSSQGVLAAIEADAQLGSSRATEAGIGLGATEDQVRAAYPDGLTESDFDYIPGGHILTHVPPDSGNGIAFRTDGLTVTGIVVGASDLIGYAEGCP